MIFTVKMIENETGEEVKGAPENQTDGGLLIYQIERDGKKGWVTCGVNMEECLKDEGAAVSLAQALMTPARRVSELGGDIMAEFLAAMSNEFIKLIRSVLMPKQAAHFLMTMAEEAARLACLGDGEEKE